MTNNQQRLRLVVINESSGGYKSGLSSCRGTPEIDSTRSTRSAGIRPDLRHFCTAWYRTPHFAANGSNPPPAFIARSITSMPPILQPIVAARQQPMRAVAGDNMQLMVVRTKEEAREEFARNLNRELDRLGAPRRGRPQWLREQLGGIVSRESCRKWLAGKDIPDQANLAILVDRLALNQQQLLTGRWEPAPSARDEQFQELAKAWPDLDERVRDAIMNILRAVTRPTPAASPDTRRRRA